MLFDFVLSLGLHLFVPTKVARHLDGPLNSAEDVGDQKLVRMEAAAACERQRMWLRKRLSENGKTAAWRPKKRHRTAAKCFTMILDQQVQLSTELSGLVDFQRPGTASDKGPWSNWRFWPHLSISTDQGTDAMAGVHALQYEYKLNISYFPDPSHGCHRDLLAMLKKSGLYDFWLLLMVAMNFQHGPWNEDYRWQQLQEGLDQFFKHQDPSTNPLFQERGHAMASELVADDMAPEGDRLRAAWNKARDAGLLQRKGYKVNLNRFLGALDGAQVLLSKWHSTLMACEYVALEEDMLGGKKLLDYRISNEALQGGQEQTTTSSQLVTAQDRLLRNAAQNSVVITIMLLEETKNKRLVQMVTTLAQPVKLWHSTQNVELRDAARTRAWFQSQVEGGVVDHLVQIVNLLSSPVALSQAGFPTALSGTDLEGELAFEDEMATLFGTIALELISCRSVRTLWLTAGWPAGCLGLCGSESLAKETAERLQLDAAAFDKLKGAAVKSSTMQAYEKRSYFQLTAVQQVLQGFAETGWASSPSQDMKDIIDKRHSGCLATQAVEDANNKMKNHKVIKGKKKFRRPQKSFAVALESRLEDKVHRFKALEADVGATSQRMQVLKRESFTMNAKVASLALHAIEGTTSPPKWWSPKPENMTAPAADLAVLRECSKLGAMHAVDTAWLGAFFQSTHMLCVRFKCATFEEEAWYVPLHHFPGSGVLAWPVTLQTATTTSSTATVVVFGTDLRRIVILPVLTLKDITAFVFCWRSVAWQRQHFAAQGLDSSVRAVKASEELPILEVAAKAAWFNLDAAFIRRACVHEQIDLQDCSSTFEVLMQATMAVLGISEQEALDICYKRVANLKGKAAFSNQLLQVDEAMQVMDKCDLDAFKREQEAVQTRAHELKSFAEEYIQAKSRLRSANPGAGQAKGKGRGKARTAVPLILPRDLGSIPHSDIKHFVPAGGRLWKSSQHRSWLGHVPPNRITSRAWTKYGEVEALRLVLVAVWQQYCDMNGIRYADCPLKGILDTESSLSDVVGGPAASGTVR